MKQFKFKIRGNSYETVIKKIENDIVDIEINGTRYKVEIEREITKPKTPKLIRQRVTTDPDEASIKKQETKGIDINAPLPGTIVKIEVKIGDKVIEGDVLLIMEAMKMENNIMAEKGGIIKEIKVSEGQSVLQNDTLIVIG